MQPFRKLAISSTQELDNHIELAGSLEMIDSRQADALQELIWEVARMLTALHRTVRERATEMSVRPNKRI